MAAIALNIRKISGVEFRVIFAEENNLGQFTK
jgi:hypothetical protein